MWQHGRTNADAAVGSLGSNKEDCIFLFLKVCAEVMNLGWPYLRDILYVGPLFPAAELSTLLRKCAPAAPERTQIGPYSVYDVGLRMFAIVYVCARTISMHDAVVGKRMVLWGL